jgi:ParB family chromosome partitioning protein
MSQEKKKVLGRGLESLLPKRLVQEARSAHERAAEAAAKAASPVAVQEREIEQAAYGLAVHEIVKKVSEAGTEAAAAGEREQFAGLSRTEALVALAEATQLSKDNVIKAAEQIERRWGAEFAKQNKIQPGEMVIQLPVTLIERNPYQTRFTAPDDAALAELAESIKVHGVMQPVVVRPLKSPGANAELYHLIAGERRWLASKRAGKTHIPAIVRDLTPSEVMVLTIIENLHRQDLNPMQHARAFFRLMDEFRLTQDEVAQKIGVPRSAVSNYLRLTRLPEFVQKAIEDGRLTFGHAKVLLALNSNDGLELCAKKVIAGRLSVRDTEIMVEEYLRPPIAVEKPERKVDPNVRAAEEDIARALGCRVRIKDRNGRGKIEIEYKSLEDFDRVVEALK